MNFFPELKPIDVQVCCKYTGHNALIMIYHVPKYWNTLTILEYFRNKNEKDNKLFYYVTDESVRKVFKEDEVLMN
jgi:hypothetical protein